MKNEGVRGLFKGMYYPILSAGALNSLFFGVYGVSLRFMTSLRADANAGTTSTSSTSIKPTNWEIFWAGCAGGAAQLVVACPVDVAKIKLQTQTGAAGDLTHYKGPYDFYIIAYEWLFDKVCDRKKGELPAFSRLFGLE